MQRNFLMVGILIVTSLQAFTQQLPPIYDTVAKDLYTSRQFVSYPKNTWLENIVKGNDGAFYVTNYPTGKVFSVSPGGEKSDYARVKGKIAGIAKYGMNEFLITGWDTTGRPSVFLVNKDKSVSLFTYLEGAKFPNGIISLTKNKYLIADSYAGCIWELNTAGKSVRLWVKSDLLSRFTDKDELPAANGLKIFNNNLYVTNTEKGIIVKIPVIKNEAGTPEKYIENVSGDDFTFDNSGNMYVAANVYNRVVKITPGKKVIVIADLQTGAAGATAVLFDKNKKGKPVIYVTTCGGMGIPPASGVEEGKILEIELR